MEKQVQSELTTIESMLDSSISGTPEGEYPAQSWADPAEISVPSPNYGEASLDPGHQVIDKPVKNLPGHLQDYPVPDRAPLYPETCNILIN